MESSVGASIKSLLFATIIDFWWHNVRIVGSVATSFWLFFFVFFCSHSLQIYFFCLVFINNIICNILKKVFYISTSNYIKKHCDFFLIICFLTVNSLVVFVQKTYSTPILAECWKCWSEVDSFGCIKCIVPRVIAYWWLYMCFLYLKQQKIGTFQFVISKFVNIGNASFWIISMASWKKKTYSCCMNKLSSTWCKIWHLHTSEIGCLARDSRVEIHHTF